MHICVPHLYVGPRALRTSCEKQKERTFQRPRQPLLLLQLQPMLLLLCWSLLYYGGIGTGPTIGAAAHVLAPETSDAHAVTPEYFAAAAAARRQVAAANLAPEGAYGGAAIPVAAAAVDALNPSDTTSDSAAGVTTDVSVDTAAARHHCRCPCGLCPSQPSLPFQSLRSMLRAISDTLAVAIPSVRLSVTEAELPACSLTCTGKSSVRRGTNSEPKSADFMCAAFA